MVGHDADSKHASEFYSFEKIKEDQTFPVSDTHIFMTVEMNKNGKFISGMDPNVRKYIETRFILEVKDNSDPNLSKKHVFPAQECLDKDFPDKKFHAHAKKAGIHFYCPNFESSSLTEKELAIYGAKIFDKNAKFEFQVAKCSNTSPTNATGF